jgi:hypothetical protein
LKLCLVIATLLLLVGTASPAAPAASFTADLQEEKTGSLIYAD